jgi:hypothetical protein
MGGSIYSGPSTVIHRSEESVRGALTVFALNLTTGHRDCNVHTIGLESSMARCLEQFELRACRMVDIIAVYKRPGFSYFELTTAEADTGMDEDHSIASALVY